MSLSKEAQDLRNVLLGLGVQCEATVPALMSAAAEFLSRKEAASPPPVPSSAPVAAAAKPKAKVKKAVK